MSDRGVPAETKQVALVTSSRPAPGTYAVRRGASPPFRGNFMIFEAVTENISMIVTSQEGTVTIGEADASVIRGSFDITGVTAVPPARTVRVVGHIHAIRPPAS